jgi:ribonuclease BN (tRNA processing enzyme)
MSRTATWTILGSGGGEAAPDRASSGHLLETPETSILFDCGDGVTGSFLRSGKRYEEVDTIIVSHTHPDHICGLSFFLQQLYLARRLRELAVYLPAEAVAGVRSALALQYLFVERFGFPVRFIGLKDNQSIPCNGASIIPHLNTHLTAHRGQPWAAGVENTGESYSFEMVYRTLRFAYSGDIGSLDDLEFCAGCRSLFVESTHIRLPELYARAESWRIRRLVLLHICPGFDTGGEVTGGFSGEVLPAEDGLVVPLDR